MASGARLTRRHSQRRRPRSDTRLPHAVCRRPSRSTRRRRKPSSLSRFGRQSTGLRMQGSKGMLAVVLAALLAGCAAGSSGGIPDAYLQDCAHAPRPAGKTVADLAQALIDERAAMEACDWRDKAALRAWKMTNTKGTN
ncbi:Rz1-like lysis system protein LysC [Burkholderia pseudomallei]